MLARPEFNTPAHILLWLGNKPSKKKYTWAAVSHCACAQYMKEHGHAGDAWEEAVLVLNSLASTCTTFGALYNAAQAYWNSNTGDATASVR
jgi:hypothetical protein